MNGSPNESLRDPSEVRRLRQSNKTFGLDNGEKWSDQKLLVDFLDSMFSESIPAIVKLDKPVSACISGILQSRLMELQHRYLTREPSFGALIPFLELVPLECFALWCAAAVKS
jgi:hypothetical protein